ncbi:MAG: ATP-dependent RNA helicase ddx51 [Thelocarpon superellum]|nr:MAG: ATP-dependent RNA helicase ddx51 [Thelocarpon superellum]
MAPPLYARYVPPAPSGASKAPGSLANGEKSPKRKETSNEGTGVEDPRETGPAPKKLRKNDAVRRSCVAPDHVEASNGVRRAKKAKQKRDPSSQDQESDDPASSTKDQALPVAKHDTSSTEAGAGQQSKHQAIFSKFHQSVRSANPRATSPAANGSASTLDHRPTDPAEAPHGLIPLPQPTPVREGAAAKPTFSALPPWLAKPVVVPPRKRVPFDQLGIAPKVLSSLRGHGYDEATAIQSVVLPLLMTDPTRRGGDLCISAATGSGKTLAYVLPMVESLRTRVVTRLRALVVVPTRELVSQVRTACDLCGSASGLQVGTAVGNHPFAVEQSLLIRKGQRYDPEAASTSQAEANVRWELGDDPEVDAMDEIGLSELLPGHVTEYTSKVDILICTPGRLVDHIRSTPGFTLAHLQWLVIDEADRLLSQSFQEWVSVVIDALERETPISEQSVEERILHLMRPQREPRMIRKVVLSATLTRDVGTLSALHLTRPQLVVVDHDEPPRLQIPSSVDDTDMTGSHDHQTDETFDLPDTLQELAVAVAEESEKPFCLLQLLLSIVPGNSDTVEQEGLSDSHPSVDEKDVSTSPAASEPSTSSDSSSVSTDDEDTVQSSSTRSRPRPRPHPRPPRNPAGEPARGVLIFTRSNESAIRLSRLLVLMHDDYAPLLGTITSTHAYSQRRRTLRSLVRGSLSIIVASDLVARGMDIPGLAHVINYDVPSSTKGYIHRVGRTARAAKEGHAWTLVSDKEARWFWREIGRGTSLRRADGRKVRRHKLEHSRAKGDVRAKYEAALTALGEEVRGQH